MKSHPWQEENPEKQQPIRRMQGYSSHWEYQHWNLSSRTGLLSLRPKADLYSWGPIQGVYLHQWQRRRRNQTAYLSSNPDYIMHDQIITKCDQAVTCFLIGIKTELILQDCCCINILLLLTIILINISITSKIQVFFHITDATLYFLNYKLYLLAIYSIISKLVL